MTHQMKLYAEPFEMIRNGQKTIELRLNDEKRRNIQIGDMIEFTQAETGERVLTEVVCLYRYPSFTALYQALPLLKCGYTEANVSAAKPEDMNLYYTTEQQKEYGVVGIEIKTITY